MKKKHPMPMKPAKPAKPPTYRQGDVLLLAVDAPKRALVPIPRDSAGRIVLAYGEVTGHAHAIHDALAELFEEKEEGQLYLRVVNPCHLSHEEHGAIQLDPGYYHVVRQREYVAGEIRRVTD